MISGHTTEQSESRVRTQACTVSLSRLFGKTPPPRLPLANTAFLHRCKPQRRFCENARSSHARPLPLLSPLSTHPRSSCLRLAASCVGLAWRFCWVAVALGAPLRPPACTSLPRGHVEPAPDSVLYLVCFHLPVTLKKDWKGSWQAGWNESLIAKTEDRWGVGGTRARG